MPEHVIATRPTMDSERHSLIADPVSSRDQVINVHVGLKTGRRTVPSIGSNDCNHCVPRGNVFVLQALSIILRAKPLSTKNYSGLPIDKRFLRKSQESLGSECTRSFQQDPIERLCYCPLD